MMKKLLAIALVSLASTGVMALNENVKMVQLNEGLSNFSIGPYSGIPISTCYLFPQKITTVVYYVNKFRKSAFGLPPVVSDPVMLDCNGVRTLINPGSSAVCTLTPPEVKPFHVCDGILKEFNQNGADGFTVMTGLV